MDKLYTTRKDAGDDSRGFIRSSGSAFVEAGKSKAALDKHLKDKYPVLWEEYTNSLSKGSARDRSATPSEGVVPSSEFNELKKTVGEFEKTVEELQAYLKVIMKLGSMNYPASKLYGEL
ncbi:hypothetical protein T440DRAFT_532686 [Plenodomus tracheiphilus IPT5]|uniref:Uncharacterized protein n=1 Tax=Plenodomus tracheiphilus IPT5 TaxID=1408161 RepID=A0A6A7ANW7_9PLEO|nr:hypothetical protein T440DRAFT_532686 [Plenodomus tracheiphilus IPT5]